MNLKDRLFNYFKELSNLNYKSIFFETLGIFVGVPILFFIFYFIFSMVKIMITHDLPFFESISICLKATEIMLPWFISFLQNPLCYILFFLLFLGILIFDLLRRNFII